MVPLPDVIGLPLDEARVRLRAGGIEIGDIVETRPPGLSDAGARPSRKQGAGLRVTELAGNLRVVRVRGTGPVDLVVTRERYVAQTASP
ncbi:MAG: hypothetical protein ACRDFT_07665 [bacterium]